MFGRAILAAGAALLPAVLAQGFSCTGTTTTVGGGAGGFTNITGFVEPRSCVPIGYFQAQDLGQIGPAQLTTVCQNQCNTYGIVCQAFVGQLWFAADSGLSTGQCFYYTTPPTGPRFCADSPGAIVGQTKGGSGTTTVITPNPLVSCLNASPAAAAPFCSAFVGAAGVGSSTTLTVTTTPGVTITSATITASGITTFVTSGFTTTTTTVTSTMTVFLSTATSGTDTTTTTTTVSTSTTDFPTLSSIDSATTDTSTTSTTSAPVKKRAIYATRYVQNPAVPTVNKLRRNLKARQTVAVPPPACFPGGSAADVSAACSCVGITSAAAPAPVTATTTFTAPATTQTVMTLVSITGSTTDTSSGTITTTATSVTAITVGTLTSTTTTTVTVTSSAIAFTNSCADCYQCTDSSNCRAGFECALYEGEPLDGLALCSNSDPLGVDYVCQSECINSPSSVSTLPAAATTTSTSTA